MTEIMSVSLQQIGN